MTPEIRKALETNILPFGEIPRELQEALVVALFVNGEKGKQRFNGVWISDFSICAESIIRLAPELVVMPEYPWDLFDDEIQWMAMNKDGDLAINDLKMALSTLGPQWLSSVAYVPCIKFPRGNVAWQDSQMERPK